MRNLPPQCSHLLSRCVFEALINPLSKILNQSPSKRPRSLREEVMELFFSHTVFAVFLFGKNGDDAAKHSCKLSGGFSMEVAFETDRGVKIQKTFCPKREEKKHKDFKTKPSQRLQAAVGINSSGSRRGSSLLRLRSFLWSRGSSAWSYPFLAMCVHLCKSCWTFSVFTIWGGPQSNKKQLKTFSSKQRNDQIACGKSCRVQACTLGKVLNKDRVQPTIIADQSHALWVTRHFAKRKTKQKGQRSPFTLRLAAKARNSFKKKITHKKVVKTVPFWFFTWSLVSQSVEKHIKVRFSACSCRKTRCIHNSLSAC